MIGRPKLEELLDFTEQRVDREVDSAHDAVLGAAMIVVEVKDKENDEVIFFTVCSDSRGWVQRAMLREATEAVDDFAMDEEHDGD
jgi:hypothetical protein